MTQSKRNKPTAKTSSSYTGPFIEVTRIGYCKNGRAHGYMGFSGKRTIEHCPQRPLSALVCPIIKDLLPVIGYGTEKQFKEDIATIKYMLDRLKFVPPNQQHEP